MSLQDRWLVRVPTASPQEPPLHDTESGLCVASRPGFGAGMLIGPMQAAAGRRGAYVAQWTRVWCGVRGLMPIASFCLCVCSAAVATAKQMTMWFGTIFGAGGGIQAFRTMPVAYQPPPRQSGW